MSREPQVHIIYKMKVSNSLLNGLRNLYLFGKKPTLVALKKINAKNAIASLSKHRSIIPLKDLPALCDPLKPLPFKKLGMLGEGLYGSVHLYKTPQNRFFAIKEQILKFSEFHKLNIPCHLGHEFKVGIALDHPNIVKVHHLFLKAEPHQVRCYLMMEFIHQSGRKTDPEQLISAVKHCLEQNILPGDLRPWNTLITKGRQLKLVDLGHYRWRTSPDIYFHDLLPDIKELLQPNASKELFSQAKKHLKNTFDSVKEAIDFLHKNLKN